MVSSTLKTNDVIKTYEKCTRRLRNRNNKSRIKCMHVTV